MKQVPSSRMNTRVPWICSVRSRIRWCPNEFPWRTSQSAGKPIPLSRAVRWWRRRSILRGCNHALGGNVHERRLMGHLPSPITRGQSLTDSPGAGTGVTGCPRAARMPGSAGT